MEISSSNNMDYKNTKKPNLMTFKQWRDKHEPNFWTRQEQETEKYRKITNQTEK